MPHQSNKITYYFFFSSTCSSADKKDHLIDQSLVQTNEFGQPIIKRQRMTPPLNERVMLYVRQDNEDVYTPLHVVPPTTIGLLNAVSSDEQYLTDVFNQINVTK